MARKRQQYMLKLWWWLLGEQHILTTTLPQYRKIGQIVNVAGECFRVTRVRGNDVWGRPRLFARGSDEITVVESPLKHLRRSTTALTAGS